MKCTEDLMNGEYLDVVRKFERNLNLQQLSKYLFLASLNFSSYLSPYV